MAIAGTSHDIVLDGVGYMLAPGKDSYISQASSPGTGLEAGPTAANALTGTNRITCTAWFCFGEKKPDEKLQVTRFEKCRPVEGGGGVIMVPPAQSKDYGGTSQSTWITKAAFAWGTYYFSKGNKLYYVAPDSGGNFGNILNTGLNLPGSINDIIYYNYLLFIAMIGTHDDYYVYTYDGSVLTDVSGNFDHAINFARLGDKLYWGTWETVQWPNDFFYTTNNVSGMLGAAGTLFIGLENGTLLCCNEGGSNLRILVEQSVGSEWVKEGKNYAHMETAFGYLWFNLGNRVYRLNHAAINGDAFKDLVLETTPLNGRCFGMLYTGDVLYFSINGQIWAFSPQTGYYLIDTETNGQMFTNLFQASISCKDAELLALKADSNKIYRWPIKHSSPVYRDPNEFGNTKKSQAASITFSGLGLHELAAAAPLKGPCKAQLVQAGIEWGQLLEDSLWPSWTNYCAGGSSGLPTTYSLFASSDGGTTFIQVGATYTPETEAVLKNGKVSWEIDSVVAEALTISGNSPAWVIFRVQLDGFQTPPLTRFWVDYRLVPVKPTSGRSWKMKLNLSNPAFTLNLQGKPGSCDGGWSSVNTALAALRGMWVNGLTVDFYDLDGTGPYRVKLTDFTARKAGESPDFEFQATISEVYR